MMEIKGGLYLVVDPFDGNDVVIPKIESALKGGVDIIQIWNHWYTHQDKLKFIENVTTIAHPYKVPVLIHEHWQFLLATELDGVHFDNIPDDWEFIQRSVTKPFITGITCGNDEMRTFWAIENKLDYISFCSMFPSPSIQSCSLVNPDIVKKTCAFTNMCIFAAGGITPENAPELLSMGINGIVIISGILKHEDPEKAASQYKKILTQFKVPNHEV